MALPYAHDPLIAAVVSVGATAVDEVAHLLTSSVRNETMAKQEAPRVTVNYAPIINVSCEKDGLAEQLGSILEEHAKKLSDQIKKEIGYVPRRVMYA